MINLIVAVDRNWGIGKDNDLLAHIKPDLQYFKNTTKGHIIVMGYNTYMSLPKRPLPDRTNVVLTSRDLDLPGATIVHSIEEIIEMSKDKKIFICGGESLYRQMMPYADRLYITHIFDAFEADRFFPTIGPEWKPVSVKCEEENQTHKHPHVFVIYEK